MATLKHAYPPELIQLELKYALSEHGIEEHIASTGEQPSPLLILEVPLSELTPALRRRAAALRPHILEFEEELEETPFTDETPPHELYPVLDKQTQDPAEVIAAWEGFAAARSAMRRQAAEKKAQEEALLEGRREAFRLQMARWIEEHGSERLKLGLQRGYKISGAYVRERAEAEFPGFTVDINAKAWWRERVSPTLEALQVETLALGYQQKISSTYKIRIVWLTRDDRGQEAKREVVVVPAYLTFYNLIGELALAKTAFDPDEIPF